ncbi:crotonyl-CoA carboxylase/reductase [Micromonospora sp. WMMD1120]|uniref:crotonyl-CoA carboxylase/reductase n=1 Tax=Micromonospora sp. WMMD1120 TaxID=3016106 RepID=UPI0024171B22|nr:crotonyl-CoA carboxylase/reductase [Micromonospora sp. WMMD1120]MDG4810792.1 crotonyl-CoA carboxylase/reductase [Micromonospora sp. WMMD1120]
MTTSCYEIGDIPPLGDVPARMYASVIRPERYGPPVDAFRTEVVDVPPLGPGQVLVMMMAAGVNYNNVWAALGKPLDVIAARRRHDDTGFHIGGSEGAGVVWAVGEGARQVKPGDHVVLSGCQWDESAPDIRAGADPMTSSTQRVWGYEANYGAFAQFTVVDEYQCHPKPARLTWEEAAAYLLTGATAYRQLCGWPPHVVRPGDPVLIWGGAGGLGSMAIQIVRAHGGVPVAVVSGDERREHCLRLGAAGVIDRREFDHWGRLPDLGDQPAVEVWLKQVRAFGQRFWEILGERRAPRIVLEHPGQDTIPTSMYLCDTAGMVVICGGTSGYHADVDLRFLWMRQKRLQGSHFANVAECRAITALVDAGRVDPCLAWTGTMDDLGRAHQLMRDNAHPPGNLAVLINAPRAGLTTLPG